MLALGLEVHEGEMFSAVSATCHIDTDIGGGQAAGLQGILVRTGKYREELVRQSAVRPDHVIASIRDLPTLLRLS